MRLEFEVFGKPRPGGSKKSFRHPYTQKIVTVEDADNRNWRAAIAEAGARALIGAGGSSLLEGPLRVSFTFVRARPAGHYGTGRNSGILKASAPAFPATRPDVLKLTRAAEDALTGQVWRDDAQIVEEPLRKVWGSPERCEILIETLPATVADYTRLELAA